ncbi:MAG: hypothetical protein ABIR81_06855 [Ginsengibacter sp.]
MKKHSVPFLSLLSLLALTTFSCSETTTAVAQNNSTDTLPEKHIAEKKDPTSSVTAAFDTADYNVKLKAMSNGDSSGKWPAKSPQPLPGAIFPFNRVVAFYGNLYSKNMGILGELPKDQMLAKLKAEVKEWQAADTSIPVIPALHYIAVTAQTNGGKQRLRMPFKQVDTIVAWAKPINALVFIDIQVGWSTVQEEVPEFEKYFKMPNVHFGIDPEFSMKGGDIPGKKIGTYDAADVNFVIDYLAKIVRANNLPPKVLIIHRFTQGMVTNVANIKKVAEVQVVMDMDGWGDKILKRSTYDRYIYKEPVQFTGFKLFYKNDTKKNKNGLYTPAELLKLVPKPMYIQYQ